MALNTVLLSGFVSTPPAYVAPSQTCSSRLTFSLRFRGRRRKATGFIDCAAWGAKADALRNAIRRGDLLFVEGELDFSAWQTARGERRSKVSLTVHDAKVACRGDKPGGSGVKCLGAGAQT